MGAKTLWHRNALGAAGALLGMAAVGFITRGLAGDDPAAAWLAAPVGASALLVFALPASPLAQPWPVIGGNLVAGVTGHMLGLSGLPLPLAVALAVGLATGAMMLMRCVHPPAGGTAALMALGGPAIAKAGWGFLLHPLGINLAVLVVAGVIWHRLTGHSYPHRAAAPPMPQKRVELHHIEQVLEEWDETLDIDPQDLAALIRALEAKAHA